MNYKEIDEEIKKLEKRIKELKNMKNMPMRRVTGPRKQDERLLPVPREYKNSFPYRTSVYWKKNLDGSFTIQPDS